MCFAAHDAQVAQRQRVGHAVGGGEVLGQRVAQPHVHAALHLLGAQPRVDRAADVVGHDDALELALLVEDDDLRGVAEGQVRRRIQDRFRRARPRREVADVLAVVLAPDELLELTKPGGLIGRSSRLSVGTASRSAASFCAACCAAAQLKRRAARRPRLAALLAELLVPLTRS